MRIYTSGLNSYEILMIVLQERHDTSPTDVAKDAQIPPSARLNHLVAPHDRHG